MFNQVIKRYEWYLLGACAVLLTVAGTIGFYRTDAGAGDVLKSLYLSIQLFILESGAVEDDVAFFSLLNVARWLSPLLLATTAIKTALSFVADDLYRIRMIRLRDHIVFLGYNDSLAPMIDNFSRVHMKTPSGGQHNKILVVTEHPGNAWITSLKTSKVLFLKHNPTDADVFRQIKAEHARYIFAVTDNDFINVSIIKGLFHIKEDHKQSRFLTAYAMITDPALKRELQHHEVFIQNTDNFDARVFNPYENSARLLYKKVAPDVFKPVTQNTTPPPGILILGFNTLARSFLTQHALLGQYINTEKARVTVIDSNRSNGFQKYIGRTHHIQNLLEIEWIDRELESLTKPELSDRLVRNRYDVVYLFVDNDTVLFSLISWLQLIKTETPFRIIASCNSGFIPNKTMREDRNRLFFLDPERESASPLYVIDEELDHMARHIHARYLEGELKKLKEKGIPLKPAAVPWSILPEEYKASNRSQADHLKVKLRCAGAEIIDRTTGDPEPDGDEMERHLGAAMIESLAKAEHNRWNAEKWIHGWEYGERDDAYKLHPNLVPWSDLDEDTRNYDRNAIRDIPVILAEVGKRILYNTHTK